MTSLHHENQINSFPVSHADLWKLRSVSILSKESLKKILSVMDSLPAELAELGYVVQRVNDAIH